MTVSEIIKKLNLTGLAVYFPGQPPALACWAGEKDGRMWFHLGDVTHWGPLVKDLKPAGEIAVMIAEPMFYACIPEEAPEITPGQALDGIAAQRAIMTRQAVLENLGDPQPCIIDILMQGEKPQAAPEPQPEL